MEKAAFRDIRTGSSFYDESGSEFRKTDSRWAVRVSDGAQYEIERRNIYRLARQSNDA